MDGDLQQKIHEDRMLRGNQYAHVSGDDGTFDALPAGSTRARHHSEVPARSVPEIDLNSIRSKVNDGGRLSRRRIEEVARGLQVQLWGIRAEIFPSERDVDPLALLDPFVALRCIGFRCDLVDSLGRYMWEGKYLDVAGIIDDSKQTVQISREFDSPVRTFTAAHELGHAVLHDTRGLHRDRALDGGELHRRRDRTEREADDFATYFLMPERLVRSAFENAFKAREFILNEDTAFALNAGDLESLRATCPEVRDLSRLLASTTRYDGVQFYSLAEQFGVSVKAMAIRLEELNLIEQ